MKKLLLSLLLLGFVSQASAVTITMDESVTQVNDVDGINDVDTRFEGTSIPSYQFLDGSTLNGDYSHMEISYSGVGDSVSFTNVFEQKRSGDYYDYSLSQVRLIFTVAADTTYQLSGSYGNTGNTLGQTHIYASLLKGPSRHPLFRWGHESHNTPNEVFNLSEDGGHSVTGTLEAGQHYEWYWYAFTQAKEGPDAGATATGFMNLDIGGGAPSNLPDSGSTFALLALSFLGVIGMRKRIRQ